MNRLPAPNQGQILLLIAPDVESEHLFELIARLSLHGPLFVLDGGNTFQGYRLASLLRHRTPDFQEALKRITLSRVFTCYQMAALLSGETAPATGALAHEGMPLLALDLLATFYDQGVRIADRRRLLKACLARLSCLSRRAPVAVWVRQRDLVPPEGLEFLDLVVAASGQLWVPQKNSLPRWKQGGLLPE